MSIKRGETYIAIGQVDRKQIAAVDKAMKIHLGLD
jgi:hypothetical protein